ncbi:MAG: extracellular solute-binding protein [Candidatus Paceibacterota bacterium]
MQNIRPFQIALLALFAIMGVVSVILLASFEGFMGSEENVYGERVIVWGTFSAGSMESALQRIANDVEGFRVVEYVEKDSRTFAEEFTNALAENRGPDVVIFPHEEFVSFRPKLLPVPYDSYPDRTFRDRFIDGGEIFARLDGIYAFPFAVDPVVMYWNRDLFSTNGLSQPPASWETLVGSVVPQIAERDGFRNIVQAAVAFGEYANITNAKPMLLTLAMQSGSRLVTEEERGYRVVLDKPATDGGRPPMNAALQFYTDFSNANSSLYTWNGSMDNDRLAFVGGKLAIYFGYGSERTSIADQNPNLNFDAAVVPQGASATVKRVYGTFYGIAITRASRNPQGSYAAVQTLVQSEVATPIAVELGLAPATRDGIAAGSGDAHQQIVYQSALIARGWLDPDPEASGGVFKQMVEDVVSSRKKVAGAISDAVRRLELAF